MKKNNRRKENIILILGTIACMEIFQREPFISFFRGIANAVVDFLFAIFS